MLHQRCNTPLPDLNLLFLIVYIHTYVRSYFYIYLLLIVPLIYTMFLWIIHILSRRATDWSVRFRFLSSESNPEILDTRSIRISTRCAVRKEWRTVVIRCSMFKWYGERETCEVVKLFVSKPVYEPVMWREYIVKHPHEPFNEILSNNNININNILFAYSRQDIIFVHNLERSVCWTPMWRFSEHKIYIYIYIYMYIKRKKTVVVSNEQSNEQIRKKSKKRKREREKEGRRN